MELQKKSEVKINWEKKSSTHQISLSSTNSAWQTEIISGLNKPSMWTKMDSLSLSGIR